jgi:hypothetical protein
MKVPRVVLLLVLLLVPMSASGQQSLSTCAPTVLPPDVSEWLKNHLAGWRIKTTEDLEAYHQKLWNENRPNQCPGIAPGHFASATEEEFALLLIPESAERRGYKVFAFIQPKGTRARAPRIVEDDKDQSSERVVLYPTPPGLYKDPENTRRVRIPRDGIVLEEMEAGGTLYFWRSSRFERLIISE